MYMYLDFEIFRHLPKKNGLLRISYFFVFYYYLKLFDLDILDFLGFSYTTTMVTTEHTKNIITQKLHKIIFFARRAIKSSAEGQSHPQELEVCPHSWLYLLL